MKTMKLLAVLTAYTLLTIRAEATTFYVDVGNTTPAAPYTNWPTAATNIQDAIDTSTNGDLVLVTNGLYNTGGRVVYGSLTNRVAINKAVTVQSVNGPAVTVIQGYPVVGSKAVRCVYLTNYAIISGFTLTNGATLNTGDTIQEQSGGGLFCCTNSAAMNCILVSNRAVYFGGGAMGGGNSYSSVYGSLVNCSLINNIAQIRGGGVYAIKVTGSWLASNVAWSDGGGAYYALLTNCVIKQNVAGTSGGGAYSSSLAGCLVVSNQASIGGGVCTAGWFPSPNVINCTIIANSASGQAGGISSGGDTVANSIIYNNTVTSGSSSNYSGATFIKCCSAPYRYNLTLTNEPQFVDYPNGNYHLQSNSPCINAGDTTFLPNAIDLDGNPRVVDGVVDIGVYEYPIASSILPTVWAQQYGLSKDGTLDSDGDGMNNLQEYIAGTIPTNAASILKIMSVSNNSSGTTVQWQSVSGKIYYMQRSTNLAGQPAFSSIRSNLSAVVTTTSFKDTNAVADGPYFYRVGVQY